MADAQRAADVLAEAGVAQVLLFGSLARGEATEQSDIDLVAVFDDLDYSERAALRAELKELARTAAGHWVDVHVTDRPEWRVRTERVLTSFERRIAAHAVPLTDTPPGDVSWHKEIGLPTSDAQEAEARLRDTVKALRALDGLLAPYRSEREELDEGRWDEYDEELGARMMECCALVQLAVETAIKSMLHLHPSGTADRWTHDVEALADRLAESHRSEMLGVVAPVPPPGITVWRSASAYPSEHEEDVVVLTPELAERLIRIACTATEHAATALEDRMGAVAAVHRIRYKTSKIRAYLDAHDLTTARPLA